MCDIKTTPTCHHPIFFFCFRSHNDSGDSSILFPVTEIQNQVLCQSSACFHCVFVCVFVLSTSTNCVSIKSKCRFTQRTNARQNIKCLQWHSSFPFYSYMNIKSCMLEKLSHLFCKHRQNTITGIQSYAVYLGVNGMH